MYRTRLAAASVVTLGLLAPAAVATTASATTSTPPAAPVACAQAVLHKEFRHINNAAALTAKNTGKKAKLMFDNVGKVTSVDTSTGTLTFTVQGGRVQAMRGCDLTVMVPKTAKILRNKKMSTLADVVSGDHVDVKGIISKDATTHAINYRATRVLATAAKS